jgi:hypothetical protein
MQPKNPPYIKAKIIIKRVIPHKRYIKFHGSGILEVDNIELCKPPEVLKLIKPGNASTMFFREGSAEGVPNFIRN